jgi:glycosyltransferase involved in cell wall biosynthesis
MKLLVITQVLDTEHPILGFFHRWVEEIAVHCDRVHVICLEEGKHSLPDTVTVHSLGKEKGRSRVAYLCRFYSLIWSLRKEYDSVFVHMNQQYVLLGALLWRICKKKIGLWYAHGTVSPSLALALKSSDYVFTCSKESFRLESKKVLVVGHGIDTKHFTNLNLQKDLDLITVGRIAPSKNLHTLLEHYALIRKTHPVTLTIVGKAVTETERVYEQKIIDHIEILNLSASVTLLGAVPQTTLPEVLNRAKVFVTVAQNGSLDKAMLEALSCGLPVVSMAEGSVSLPLLSSQVTTQEDFVTEVKKVLESKQFYKPEYTYYVQNQHSLTHLIPRIIKTLS